MKHFNMKSLVCLLLVLLLAATALTGCTNNTETTQAPKTEAPATEAPATEAPATEAPATETPATEAPATDAPAEADREELGEGAKVFYLDVTTTDGATTSYAIHTDADTVGQALLDLKVIDGEEAGYGLYVTTVCGETLDWDADGMYWAFYVDGDYASTGVDATEITEGATYALAATKG